MGHRIKKPEEKEADAVPRVSMDYFCMSQRDDKENPMLVVLNEESNEKFARMTGRKGVGEAGECDWLIKELSREMRTWDHAGGPGGRIIPKSDRENVFLSFRNVVARFHGGIIIPEEPPKNDSQSNGAVEEACKIVQEFAPSKNSRSRSWLSNDSKNWEES